MPWQYSIQIFGLLGTLLQSIMFGCCNLDADEDEEVTFIGMSQWPQQSAENIASRKLEDINKRHCNYYKS